MYNLNKNKVLIFIRLPLIIYWLTIFILTSLPSELMPKVSVGDKLEHFLAFLALGFLIYLNIFYQYKITFKNLSPLLFSIIIISFYGALNELSQLLIPGRSAEILDWIADFFGGVVGVKSAEYFLIRYKNQLMNILKINSEHLSEVKVK
jgi:VanZ family protein